MTTYYYCFRSFKMTIERRNPNAVVKTQVAYLTLLYLLSQAELLAADESDEFT